jgi:serine/threonine protein kinase
MVTTLKHGKIGPGCEPIKGYVLEERIGRGGYGEVWRAEAPGGIKKAVKFVYGQQDERRAEQELKSLERIKGINHPFILTLERFELVNNQLVIVTELAEGSLEEIYKQHRDRGSCGIPRDALLKYMRDAADALDYLHQLYKLQHLDIKPGNLLLVGGRVKVADFGLLKDLGDVECSLIGGLTPIYAPPEVFDGRPNMHSDQYSLAVMYQELLTSTRPFSGRTIAQLATQHVHNAPNLNPLPAADRPCVARALEKNPERRFGSCTEFVEKLLYPYGHYPASIEGSDVAEEEPKAVEIENLPQLRGLSRDDADAKQTHLLVIGLGGTGADCLRQIRNRVSELGAASPVTLHSVLIDSDPVTTHTAALLDETKFIPCCRTLHTRLRSAQEYRNAGTEKFRTISRRWIYNVPRNGSTNGMRPLGRLALVDHGEQVVETLRAAVEDLKDSLKKGINSRIYVVSSLTGGTGSGMYIDVVHLLRHIMDDSAMENHPILSLLTTNRFKGDPSRPLALHATKSAFAEISHFLQPGNSYPGDEGAGWPGVPAARTPLHDAYVIAQSDVPGAPTPLHCAVDYLWTDVTICGDLLEKGRRSNDEKRSTGPTIRSLGVVQIGDSDERQSSLLAPYTTKALLMRWMGSPNSAEAAARDFVECIQHRFDLMPDQLRQRVMKWFGPRLLDRRELLTKQLKRIDANTLANPTKLRCELLQYLTGASELEQSEVFVSQAMLQIQKEFHAWLSDERLDLSSTLSAIDQLSPFLKRVAEKLLAHSEKAYKRLEAINFQIPDEPPGCPVERQESTDEQQAFSARTGEAGQPSPDREATGTAENGSASDSESPVVDHRMTAMIRHGCELGEGLINVIASRVGAAIATTLESKLSTIADRYSEASAKIAHGIQQLSEDIGWSKDPWVAMDESLQSQLPKILTELHQESEAKWLQRVASAPATIGIDHLINDVTTKASRLIRKRTGNAHSSDIRASDNLPIKNSSTVRIATTGKPSSSARSFTADMVEMTQTMDLDSHDSIPILTVDAAVAAVRPVLLECGGRQRLLMICRDEMERDALIAQLPSEQDLPLTPVMARTAVPMFVHEAQDIKISQIVSWLDSLTGDDGKISARLTSRQDIQMD